MVAKELTKQSYSFSSINVIYLPTKKNTCYETFKLCTHVRTLLTQASRQSVLQTGLNCHYDRSLRDGQ
jgi:hypothetical protein